jgi:hypothetical protein
VLEVMIGFAFFTVHFGRDICFFSVTCGCPYNFYLNYMKKYDSNYLKRVKQNYKYKT